jgi:hypothetical protein
VTGNRAGANHLAELDAHLESHIAELRRHAQRSRDELVAQIDGLSERAAPPPPPRRPSSDAFDDFT